MASDDILFSFIFYVNSIYTSEKCYIKTPCILNHAKKMAYNLHKLSDDFWLWNSLGLNGMELQEIFPW